MKSLLFAAALATASVTSIVPVLAQPMAVAGQWSIDRRLDWVSQRIDRGLANGSLDRRQAFHARRVLQSIRHEAERMRIMNGGHLNDVQRARIEARIDDLNDHLHWLRENNEARPW